MSRQLLGGLILTFLGFPCFSQTPIPYSKVSPQIDHYSDPANYDLIKDQINCMETEISLTFNQRVYGFIKYFTEKDRDYTRMVLERSTYYFPIFEKYLEEYDLPDEIKYLAIIESGLNPKAISRVGAVGLWQFMPYTGRSFKLHQDWYIDERMDPYKSTEAACKYLSQLYGMFKDWELALAAYNTGPGNVRKAIRRSGYKKKFWEIYPYLPRETRSYLPQWVAITYVMSHPQQFNFIIEDWEYEMSYDTIMISDFSNLNTVGEMIGVCREDLEKLNPSIKHLALNASKQYPVKIPIQKIDYLRDNRSVILDSASKSDKKKFQHLARNTPGSTYGRDRIVYRVSSGDVLGSIAIKYNVRVSDIRKWNNFNGNLIRVGQRLNIWVYPGARNNINTMASVKAIPKTELENGQKIYYVQPGDTLWDISRKFKGLSIEKLKTLNDLNSNNIQPGQKLIIG